ncbi:LapB repeat-containing protein [Listeria monocytogenes]
MKSRFLASILSVSLLLQVFSIPAQVFAEEVKQQKTNVPNLVLASKDPTTNKQLTLSLSNLMPETEYKLKVPTGMNYIQEDKTKEFIHFDKEKKALTISSVDGKNIDIHFSASEAKNYELQLETEDVKSAKLLVTIKEQPEEKVTEPTEQGKETEGKSETTPSAPNLKTEKKALLKAGIQNMLVLNSTQDKSTLSSYTEQVNVNFNVNYLDASSTLKNGQLVIDFGDAGLEPVNFPKDTSANSRVKSASYDNFTKKLTVNFIDNLTSGSPFDFPLIARATGDAETGEVELNATLTGQNNSLVAYEPAALTAKVNLNLPAFKPIVAGDTGWSGNWKNPEKANLMPGERTNVYPKLQKTDSENRSFQNLKIEILKETGVTNGAVSRFAPYVVLNGSNTYLSGKLIEDTSEKQVIEYGALNSNIYNSVGFSNYLTAPEGATAGSKYTTTVNIYDRDVLVDTIHYEVTVASSETTVDIAPSIKPTEIQQGGYFDWNFAASLKSADSGIRDLQITAPVPEGFEPMSYSAFNNTGTTTKSIEYKQSGIWKTLTDKTAGGWDFSKVVSNGKITDVRINVQDTIGGDVYFPNYSPAAIRLKNVSVPDGQTTSFAPSSISYLDHTGTEVNVDVTDAKYTDTIKSVASITAPASINGYVGFTESLGKRMEFGQSTVFNGDVLGQTIRIGNYANQLENPYIFVVVPKGMEVNALKNYIAGPYASEIDYRYAPTNSALTVAPKSGADVKGSEVLADGSTIYYWEVPDIYLSPSSKALEMFVMDAEFKLKNVNAGTYQVEFGMGSMTDSNWTINGGTLNTGLQQKNLPTDLQSKLPGVSSSTYLSTKRSFTVGQANSIDTKMQIKGSQDSDYVDVTSKKATTIPGKNVDYKVSFENTGTNPIKELEIIDILPEVGDNFVLGNGTRGSEFSVIPTDDFEIYVNGTKSSTATLEYSTSATPERFNTSGADVAGDPWQMAKPTSMADVKSVRIKLPDTIFEVGDKIELRFKGTVPLDAPRNGETAYNSVAYRMSLTSSAGVTKVAAEPPKGGVQSTKPATDLALNGTAFMDLNKNGVQDANELGLNSTELTLYEKQSDGKYEAIETINTAPGAGSKAGIYGFTGLANGTYKVAAKLPANASFVTTGANAILIDSEDPTKGWLSKDGSNTFTIDDLAAGNPKTIDNIKAPIYLSTPVQGSVVFVNKNGERKVTTYGKDYEVKLLDKAGTVIKNAVTTSATGEFAFENVTIQQKGDYKLEVKAPNGSKFVYAPKNTVFNDATGEYPLNDLVPGVGATAEIYITDTDDPTTALQFDKKVSPTSIEVKASDDTTKTTSQWEVVNKADNQIVHQNVGTNVRIPADDGSYTVRVTTRDEAGNEATAEEDFEVDHTAPVITANTDATVKVNSTEAAIQWIKPLTATGADTRDGSTTVTVNYDRVDFNTLGTYPVTLTSTDSAGNKGTKDVTIRVLDNEKPVITVLNSPLSMTVEAARALTENSLLQSGGVTAVDNYDLPSGSVLTAIKQPLILQTNFSEVFPDVSKIKAGTYAITVNTTDSSGNKADEKTINITVTDTVAPVITASNVTYHINSTKTEADFLSDAKVIATDNNDSASDITITSDYATVVKLDKTGTYEVTLTAIDKAGNSSTEKVNVSVEKNLPVIKTDKTSQEYAGKSVISNTQFLIDINAQVTDEEYSNLSVTSDFATAVNLSKMGTYTVTLEAQDPKGNKAKPVKITVNVVNTNGPGLSHTDNQTIEATNDNLDFATIFGVTATGYMDNKPLSVSYTTTDVITPNQPGNYTVTASATDAEGLTTTKDMTLTIQDTTAPVITTTTDERDVTILSQNVNWKELFGLTATDIVDGNMLDQVVTDDSNVNLNKTGTYTVTFDVTDAAGNKATTKQVQVHVVNQNKPVITGDTTYQLEVEEKTATVKPFTEAEWITKLNLKASSSVFPDIEVKLSGTDKINYQQVGQYTLTATAIDEDGNEATPLTIKINVVDTTVPIITTTTDELDVAIQSKDNDWKKLFGLEATDNVDGDMTKQVTVDDSKVNLSKSGTYTISFDVTDTAGNKATTKQVKVRVINENKPEITGDTTYQLEVEGKTTTVKPFTEAEWIEKLNLNSSSSIFANVAVKLSGLDKIDYQKVGEYTLIATSIDEDGNEAKPVTIKVNVVDTTKPVLELAKNKQSYKVKEKVTSSQFLKDIKAKATDNYSDVQEIKVTSNFEDVVNLNKTGTYTVTVTAVDENQNKTSQTVEVSVIKDAPVIKTDETKISYPSNKTKKITEATFLKDIGANAIDQEFGAIQVTSDFNLVVDQAKSGSYTVTLKAEGAESITITVIIEDTDDPELIVEPTEPNKNKPSSKGSDNVIKAEKNLPKTGDNPILFVVIIGLMLSGLGITLLKKKSKTE